MQPSVWYLARKELSGFFASPAALLFLGVFLAVTLFVFFWVEAFFSRNIADVRPLFEWMPVLLIFLVAALTMRAWSEERRAGTLELLATAPVRPLRLVLGKFLGGLGLVAIALALTLPLPITVAFLGPLDWGPVFGGYLAALFLAAAYLSIGLWVSARTDNAIVALIGSTVVCGIFYLLGTDVLTTLVGHRGGELLQLIGAGSRFDSITRGVIDARDLYYYGSIVGVFLTLNLLTLERLRWEGNPASPTHRRWQLISVLAAANFLAANLWLAPQGWARADLTEGHIYSLSEATKSYLAQLREPLLIRGYFSAQTHPLLAPLVPQVRDLLEEYAQAGGQQVRVEFVDPHDQPALEEEAGARYGIRPVPFQTASKYQASVVNSYFDILVAYGDQYETLNYQDLIDIKVRSERDIQVELKNPEYDITRAIRKTLTAYQGGGNPFESLSRPVVFQGYISPKERLPESLATLRDELTGIVAELEEKSAGKLSAHFSDPDAGDGSLAQRLADEYGFRPLVTGLLDPDPFWFSLLLKGADGEAVPVPLPAELDKAGLQRSIEAALKRFSPGFLKTLAVLAPPPGGTAATAPRFEALREVLGENLKLKDADLKDGKVPTDADLLLVLAPEDLDDKQLFAIDQFLMQGGTVILSSAPFSAQVDRSISARRVNSGLHDWLASHGIELQPTLVLDPDNAALPVPVERNLGGFAIQEIRMLDYPYFPSLRGAGLNPDSPITSALGEVAMTWASPITLDQEKNKERAVTWLLRSSERSWNDDSLQVMPDFQRHPRSGFEPAQQRQASTLALAVQGRFDSWFAGKDSPLTATAPGDDAETDEGDTTAPDGQAEATTEQTPSPVFSGVIDRSPESARIILFASNGFLSDTALTLAGQGLGTFYTKPIELLQNTVDWALDDGGLAGIRSRGHFARTLVPMERDAQLFWEYLNYILAMLGLLLIWLLRRRALRTAAVRYQRILEGI